MSEERAEDGVGGGGEKTLFCSVHLVLCDASHGHLKPTDRPPAPPCPRAWRFLNAPTCWCHRAG